MPEAGPAGVLAIVAGRGDLPHRLALARREAGLPVLLVVFQGYFAPWMTEFSHQNHEFERAGALLRSLRAAGVTHIAFAGAMTRPRLKLWRADFKAWCLLGRALWLLRRGDDEMLRGFGAILEAEGLRLIGPREILGEELTISSGPLGRLKPGAQDLRDAARAREIVHALAPLDVGQGAVVAGGLCLGIEALGGTDHLLAEVARLPETVRPKTNKGTGVLFKTPKQGQDLRLDLPAIGPRTIEGAAAAGLSGIVVAAGRTLVLGEAETRAAADKAGLFVYGMTDEEPG